MKPLKLEVTVSPFVVALLVLAAWGVGLAFATVAGAGSRWVGDQLQLNGSSGTDGLAFETNGLRLHLGTGSGDYIDSNGTDMAAHTKLGITPNFTSCTLDGGTPGVCNATVTSGADCVGVIVGTTRADALAGLAISVSGTTLTATADNGHTNVVNIICDK